MPENIALYSAWYCPFAQRTWIALEHLEIPYKYHETDPYVKSSKWLSISRNTGQVPVLEITGQNGVVGRIPNSLRTLEYLNEAVDIENCLFPTEPLARSEARFWLDHQSVSIIPYFYRLLKAPQGSNLAEHAETKLLSGISEFANAMSRDGPFFLGEQPSVVDFAFAPFALRIKLLLSHYKNFPLPTEGKEWRRYNKWWQEISQQAAVLKTMPEIELYEERLVEYYLPYSQNGGQTNVTEIAQIE